MILFAAPAANPSPAVLEFLLTLLVLILAFAFPAIASQPFRKLERAFHRLARNRTWSVVAVGASAFLLRLAILAICPIPMPFVPDDFSFLLSADTFAMGRLANPTPAMWTYFESIHISMTPTYGSMYFPATGLVLAAGKVLTGQPWFGLLVVTSLMCSAICWMLQAWLPPGWALLGGAIAVLRIGLFSYWINTYHGGGAVSALGGALVLGAAPRLMRKLRHRDALLLAIGIILLLLNRPYEGLLLCMPVAALLGHWIFFSNSRPAISSVLMRSALPLFLILAAMAWLGYYDYRAFGSPTILPYTLNRATYGVVPYFLWQSARAIPTYHHEVMRTFYTVTELPGFTLTRTLSGLIESFFVKILIALLFFCGFALIPSLFQIRRAFMDRRIRFLIWCFLVMVAGMSIQIFLFPHYIAPFTAIFYAIGLQSLRHLRLWTPGGKRVGLALTRLSVTAVVIMAAVRLGAEPLHLTIAKWPPSGWLTQWYGPLPFGEERAQIEAQLERLPGKQLAIVRYAPNHATFDEWVYNAADLDNAKVIWARESDGKDHQAEEEQLIAHYKDRQVWLIQPDQLPPTMTPYPIQAQALKGVPAQ